MKEGVLSDRDIRKLIEQGAIKVGENSEVNPGSLDLSVGTNVWNMLGCTRPLKGQNITDILENHATSDVDHKHNGEKGEPFYLDPMQPYVFELDASLDLPNTINARVFNKSGRGRIGTSVKTLTSGNPEYDSVTKGFEGNLYSEIAATAFREVVRLGETAMPQIRFYQGNPSPLSGYDLELELMSNPVLFDSEGNPMYSDKNDLEKIAQQGELTFTADLSKPLIAYKAKRDPRTIDLSNQNFYDPNDFFIEERSSKGGNLTIHPGEFVLVHSKEDIVLPPHLAAEITTFSEGLGDLKTHYAGLINPGHGYNDDNKNHIVFEMKALDMPYTIQDGSLLAKFGLYRMLNEPEGAYSSTKSTDFYNLKSILPKQFKKD